MAGRVAISGADGFVARNLRRLLAQKGISAVCLARRDFEGRKNEDKVITDYTHKLLPKLGGCDVFVHLVGIGRQNAGSDYSSVNVNLTKRLLGLCGRAGVKKFVFNSGLGASPESVTDYFVSKYRAEQAVIRSGLDYTIFRPSYIIGKDDHLTKSLKRQIRAGQIVIPGSGRFPMQPIHIDDACRIILQSINSGYSRKTVDLVGPETVTYGRLVSALRFKKTKKISLEEAYRRAMRDPDPVFGIDDLNILVGGFTGDFKALKKSSGLEFAGYADALEASGLS